MDLIRPLELRQLIQANKHIDELLDRLDSLLSQDLNRIPTPIEIVLILILIGPLVENGQEASRIVPELVYFFQDDGDEFGIGYLLGHGFLSL